MDESDAPVPETRDTLRTDAAERLVAEGYDPEEAAKVVSIVAPAWERKIEQRARVVALRRQDGQMQGRRR